jgi:CRISPR-associated endonuclease/helicase Cas3
MRVLQQLRKGKSWQQAWDSPINIEFDGFMKNGMTQINDVLDFCVATHHGLFCKYDTETREINNDVNNFHVRNVNFKSSDFQVAGNIDPDLLSKISSGEKRLNKMISGATPLELEYLAWISRAMLIMADQVVSATHKNKYKKSELYANTDRILGQKNGPLNQPLDYHLTNVGEYASNYAYKFLTEVDYPALSSQTISNILTKSTDTRFVWQDIACEHFIAQPESNFLIFNIANTGCGKTLANLKLATTISKNEEQTRISICLNLRSLTLQTGREYNRILNPHEIDAFAVLIGDKTTQQLFDNDCDENITEPNIDIDENFHINKELPEWLELFCDLSSNRNTILAAPLLVSTVDYLIKAATPSAQGHHVASLIRAASSDLILDEVDGYEPNQLVIICKLIELVSFFGRNVICSTATLSTPVADLILIAFNRGREARQLLIDSNHTSQFGIVDNIIKPSSISFGEDVKTHYMNTITTKNNLNNQVITKLAKLTRVPEVTEECWFNSIAEDCVEHHNNHQWIYKEATVSIGLIRVANIKHGIALSKFLTQTLSNVKVCFYHANDFKIARFHKEQILDRLLTRKNPNKVYSDLDSELEPGKDIMFIVVATPVEEIGRDHDFDWAIIEPSSCSSIIQTAGRVNRHRLIKQTVPNISILQYNHRNINNHNKSTKISFVRPGLECQLIGGTSHPSKDIEQLLPWDNDVLQISSTLRFNSVFASCDDTAISNTTTHAIKRFFSTKHTLLLKNKFYNDYRLRDNEQQTEIILGWENGDTYKFCEYKQLPVIRTNKVLVDPPYGNTWLSLSHLELNKKCKANDVPYYIGKSLSVRKVKDETSLHHDWSFGWWME